MSACLRLLWQVRASWGLLVPLLLTASTVNWMQREAFDGALHALLAGCGILLAHRVYQTTSRETLEYVRGLPFRRGVALFLPYSLASALVLFLALIVTVYDASGLAYYPVQASLQWFGSEAAGALRPHHRDPRFALSLSAWALAGFWSNLLVFEELRRRIDPELVRKLARSFLVALSLGAGFSWLGVRGEDALSVPLTATDGALFLLLVTGLVAWRVQRLVVGAELEAWPAKEQAWDS